MGQFTWKYIADSYIWGSLALKTPDICTSHKHNIKYLLIMSILSNLKSIKKTIENKNDPITMKKKKKLSCNAARCSIHLIKKNGYINPHKPIPLT